MIQLGGSHRRYNPLLDQWVLCSPQRMDRPWQGHVSQPSTVARPSYDPECYLCPGNARANGHRNAQYDGPFVFDNDFPAVDSRGSRASIGTGLLRAQAESGVCRVVCFTPRHDLSLARMPVADVRAVVDSWAEESARIGLVKGIGHVQVFENRGELMGCSNPHPHAQIWATTHIPTIPTKLSVTQNSYFESAGRDLLGDYLEQELRSSERVVFENDYFVVLVPFWAVWPFETMILPRRAVGDLPSLDDMEREALADAVRRLTIRFDNLFHCEFPYSMGFAQRPTDGGRHEGWRLHAAFSPPLLRSAAIRKFLVGYELSAEPQRDLSAEHAAERLRGSSERHYLDGGE